VVPQKLPPSTVPPRHSPPTTQEIPRYTYPPPQQYLPPPPANPPRTGNVHVVLGIKPPRSDSPPLIRRSVAGSLPTTSSLTPSTHQQQQLPRITSGDEPRSKTEHVPPPQRFPAGNVTTQQSTTDTRQLNAAAYATAAAANSVQRPVTRSLRLEALQYEHFRLLPHPIMVRLYVAGSQDMGLQVTQNETVRQGREATFLYLYAIQPRMILDGGPNRYPWESIFHQTNQYVEQARRAQRVMMPLFLLQHIQTGGFISPGDDISLRTVFAEMDPVPCAPLMCRVTTDLASSLLVVDDINGTSRTKLHLKFFKKELISPNISFVANGGDMFCCQYAVSGSMLVVHQLFSGAPERLCLRCNQYYQYHGRRGGSRDAHGQNGSGVEHGRSPGGCDHFSQVDEVMEVISKF
jgi:hypothetical protein